MSGYGRDDAERSVGPAEPNGFLQKPFSFDALLQVLRRILGHAEEG
jgi:hypothetical protein